MMDDGRSRDVESIEPLRAPPHPALDLPGSKSHANRLLVLAALHRGERLIRYATPCDDVDAMVGNLARMGFQIAWLDRAAGVVRVVGGLPNPSRTGASTDAGCAPVVLDCGLGGTTRRFLLAVAALVPGRWLVTGAPRLLERPIEPLRSALRGLGVQFDGEVVVGASGVLGALARADSPASFEVEVDASVSSQFLTALLLIASVFDDGTLQVRVTGPLASAGYLAITRRALCAFGKDVRVDPVTQALGIRTLAQRDDARLAMTLDVDVDASAAAFWSCLAELTGGGFHVARDASAALAEQPDGRIPDVLRALRGAGDRVVDITASPDQFMNLAVVAARREGRTDFVGTNNLRHKESDRPAVLARAFEAVGIDCEVQEDRFVVHGPAQCIATAELDPCGDHRMVIAFCLLGLMAQGIRVRDPHCVEKSYPGFFADLARSRASHCCVAIVGLRGAGKSTLARALGARLGLEVVDTDESIERAQGRTITAIVRDVGWVGFRALEADAVAAAAAPNRVVALGGGAIETSTVRAALTRGAFVVWIDESLDVCAERIEADGLASRPSLTGSPVLDELRVVAASRRAIYRGLARLTLPSGQSVSQRVEQCIEALRAAVAW